MIGYLARTLPLVVRAQLRRDGRLVSRIRQRVHLRQLDVNLHMNQAMYAEVMELGRTDWVLRSGAWPRWRAQGVHPVVAEQRIIYRRELRLHQRFTVDSRAIGVEGRLLQVQSHMLVGDRVHARADVKLIFIGPDGVVDGARVEALCAGLRVEPLGVEDWRVVGAG